MKLVALLRQLRDTGFDVAAFVKYLVEHTAEISAIVSALMALFAAKGFASADDELSEDEAIAECVAMGCDEADCEAINNALAG